MADWLLAFTVVMTCQFSVQVRFLLLERLERGIISYCEFLKFCDIYFIMSIWGLDSIINEKFIYRYSGGNLVEYV